MSDFNSPMLSDDLSAYIKGMHLLGAGRTAEVYGLDAQRVLKLFYSWYPADWAEAEVAGQRVLAKYNLPIAEILATVVVEDRFGIVYRRIAGGSLLDKLLADPGLAQQTGKLLAELHFQIHQFEAAHLPSLQTRLIKRIRTELPLPKRTVDQIVTVLDRLPKGSALCHGDFHPGQVLGSEQQPYIIDWSAASGGNPLADVASTLILLRIAHIPLADNTQKHTLELIRKPLHDAYLERYLRLAGKTKGEELGGWLLVMAAARLSEGLAAEEKHLQEIIDARLCNCDHE